MAQVPNKTRKKKQISEGLELLERIFSVLSCGLKKVQRVQRVQRVERSRVSSRYLFFRRYILAL